MKALIKYSDYLNGEKPKVGDKIVLWEINSNGISSKSIETIVEINLILEDNKKFFVTNNGSELYPEECFYEVEYNEFGPDNIC